MAEKVDMRMEALDTLIAADRGIRRLDRAVEETLIRNQFVPERDRAFYRRLCEGVTERRIYLDYILNHYSSRPMNQCKPLIRNLLRLSAYQILFMDVRDAAACSEAVKIAKKRRFKNLSGFVNGVLRTIVREKEQLPVPDHDKETTKYYSVIYSIPEWMVRLLMKQYGEEAAEGIFRAMEEVRPLVIRTNECLVTPEQLQKELEDQGVTVKPGDYLPCAFHISGGPVLERLTSFQQGHFAVQDESSMLPAEVAGIRKGDQILDICSAPGGKTYHAAGKAGREGHVLARDLTEYKIELLEENRQRLRMDNVTIELWDATEFDVRLVQKMDVVLCDLPCSGLGVMGRKNDIRYNTTEESAGELAELQRKILSNAWQYVKPGGTLIYSTCTLNREENEVNAFWLAANSPLKMASIEEYLPEKLRGRTGDRGYLQLVPGKDSCDGFFVARFVMPEEE